MDKKDKVIGQKFGLLTAIKFSREDKYGNKYYICQCSCKKKTIKEVQLGALRNGRTQSCGCLVSKRNKERIGTHVIPPHSFTIKDDTIAIINIKDVSVIVDKEDLNLVLQYRWFIGTHGYAITNINHKKVAMHKLITNTGKDIVIDHKNGNILDNRKDNLRITVHQKNCLNKKERKDNSSGYTGVQYMKNKNKYNAFITYKGKRYSLLCKSIKEAAYARYIFEKILFQDFSIFSSREKEPPEKPNNYQEIEQKICNKLNKK